MGGTGSNASPATDPVIALTAIACYRYHSCKHRESSDAAVFCQLE